MIATIFVDLTGDFVDGALPNPRGHEVCLDATTYMRRHDRFKVGTRDIHDPDAPGTQEHLRTYGIHGVPKSPGARFHSAFQSGYLDAVLDKGWDGPGASAFDGKTYQGRSLFTLLRDGGITEVEVCGLVAEICVWETIHDALSIGLRTTWLVGLTAALDGDEGMRATAKKVLQAGGYVR